MSDFLNRMKSAAKADLKTIVLPEGEDPRTIVAATKIIEEGLAKIVILGNPDEINVPGATVIDPRNAEKHEEYAQEFAELRAKKGVTIEQARAQVMDATYFGTMMVKMGDADGLVSGACHSTADTLRPALQILKTAPGTKLVSAFFVMCTDTPQFGTDGTLIFADCGLNINPSSDELSEIAIASAHSWSTFMGNVEPHVAMLSYSTMGSAGGEVAKKVQEAVKFCKEKAPELAIDGDLQLDAAIVPTVAQLKLPAPLSPARPTCSYSPTSRPATSATSWSSASPAPMLTAPSCRASPSRLTTFRAAALPTTSWVSWPSPPSRLRWLSSARTRPKAVRANS